jgi:fucose permease
MVAMMVCVGIVQPVLFTVNQNVVAPSLRGSAASVSLTVGKVGNALGPLAVGIVSSQIHDLGSTFLVLTPTAWLLAAGCAALAVKGMQRDVTAMEDHWAARDGGAAAGQIPSESAPGWISPVVES